MSMDIDDLKQVLKPIDVAQRYLGNPQKRSGNSLVYKSPFRSEKTASFWVNDEKGFHDYGDGWHGDVIDFTRRLFSLSLVNAIRMLSNDFGINTYNEYKTDSVITILKKQREIAAQRKEIIEKWYNKTYGSLCDMYHYWADVKEQLKDKTNAIGDFAFGYDTALDKVFKAEYLIDYLAENCDNKEALFANREGIECYMRTILN